MGITTPHTRGPRKRGPKHPTLEFFDRPEFQATLLNYARANTLSEANARRHFVAVAQYLTVAACAPVPVSPSRALDRPWHAFICSTRLYREFCERTFGKFIEHEPYAPGGEQPGQYGRAYTMAVAMFGLDALDRNLWTDPRDSEQNDDGDCG